MNSYAIKCRYITPDSQGERLSRFAYFSQSTCDL